MVSLVSSFFVSVVAIVTGHIALSQIKRTGEKGRGLAIGGLIIGYAALVLTLAIIAAFIFAGIAATTLDQHSSGQSSSGTKQVTSAPVPTNMNAFGGMALGKDAAPIAPPAGSGTVDLKSADAQSGTDAAAMAQIGIAATKKGQPVQVVLYLDLMCPACQQFENVYGPQLKEWQDAGKITIEYRPIAILDRFSQGSKYSTRAGAAAACVAAESPSNFKAYIDALYANKPEENSAGLNNAALNTMAAQVGASGVDACISSQKYAGYVTYSTNLISAHGLLGTPQVYVDGQLWDNRSALPDFVNPLIAAK